MYAPSIEKANKSRVFHYQGKAYKSEPRKLLIQKFNSVNDPTGDKAKAQANEQERAKEEERLQKEEASKTFM